VITLTQATTIVDATLEEANKQGFHPMCVVVLDTGGHAIVLKRDERAAISRPEIATAKAAGCLGMGFGGRELQKRAEMMPAFIAGLNDLFPKGLLPVPGGLLIRDSEGKLLGAVGVSGDTSDNDEIAALAGIEAAGLVAVTGV